jgi:hypothetical protein
MSTNLPHPETVRFEFEGQQVLARTGQSVATALSDGARISGNLQRIG